MPELPEVETIRRTLAPHLVGRTIVHVDLIDPHMVRAGIPPDAFGAALTGKTAEAVERRGKYLLIRLSGDLTWMVHLRMSGRLSWWPGPADQSVPRFLRLRVQLDDGSVLDMLDMRRLGMVCLLGWDGEGAPAGLRELGPEALDPEAFSVPYLAARARGRDVTVKGLLLDQHVVAGLGNIYVDEALHRSGIHPGRRAGSLNRTEVRDLYGAIRAVLLDGIEHLGVSFSLYRDAEGNPGFMSDYLRVYGRAGAPCATCQTPIARTRIAGRGTAFCPKCQPLAPRGRRATGRVAKTSGRGGAARGERS